MEKKQFYRAVIFILIVFNIGCLTFIYLGSKHLPPHPPMKEGPKQLIIDQLGFDKQQQKKYSDLIKIHRKEIYTLEQKRASLKNELYSLLGTPNTDTQKRDSLIDLLAENHRQVELIHFHHFGDIKNLCHNEIQLKKFDKLSLKFSSFFASPMQKHK